MKHLVIDIEAIRDLAVWEEHPPEPGSVYLEERPKPRLAGQNIIPAPLVLSGVVLPSPGKQFAPPYAWRPIVIGCVLLESTDRGFRVTRVGAIEVRKEVEPNLWEDELLRKFAQTISQLGNPELVTWNGREYDLPVLMLRSMRYGISCGWYYRLRGHRYRFSEEGHCDLADAMRDYGATRQCLSLDGMSKLIGLPGKFWDIDGAGVAQAFTQGRHAEIAGYCMADAVSTAFLFLRWQLHKEEIGINGYQEAVGDLLRRCREDPRLQAFAARIDEPLLLLGHPPAAEASAPAPEAA